MRQLILTQSNWPGDVTYFEPALNWQQYQADSEAINQALQQLCLLLVSTVIGPRTHGRRAWRLLAGQAFGCEAIRD